MIDEQGDGRRKASAEETVELASHLATLARSGLPLPEGLRAVGAELGTGTLPAILRATASRLDRGEPLGEALAAQGGQFPASVRALVEAGVRTGRLVDFLAEFVRHANLGRELRRGVVAAVAYPLLLLVILIGIVTASSHMATRATWSILSMMQEFGIAGTPQNSLILGLAGWVADWGLLSLLGLLVGAAIAAGVAGLTLNRVTRRRFVNGLPLVGPTMRWSALAEFSHLLGLLVDAEVPMPEALRMAGASVHDADLAAHCDEMARAVEDGQPLSAAVQLWPAIPAGLGQIFLWGESRATLPEALHLAGDLFEARARTQSDYTNTVFIGILLLLIANGLAFAVLLLQQPIQLISKLSGTFIAPGF